MFASVKFAPRHYRPYSPVGSARGRSIALARMFFSGAIVVSLFVTVKLAFYMDREDISGLLDYNRLNVIQPDNSDDPNIYRGRNREHPRRVQPFPNHLDVANNDDVIDKENAMNLTQVGSHGGVHFVGNCVKGSVCYLFQHSLKSWPADKPKAVIYTLARAGTQEKQLKKMIVSLFKNFNSRFNYPVIIFYHGPSHGIRIEEILAGAPGDAKIYFQKVDMLPPPVLPAPSTNGCYRDVLARHECRFNSGVVYSYPILRGVEYLWRLDADAELSAPLIDYDLFVFMQKFHLSYGYIVRGAGQIECATRVVDAVNLFMTQNNVTPTYLHRLENDPIFRTGFEISKLAIWQSPSYRRFVDYIDRFGGIFRHGWCDDVIKSLALSVLVPAEEIHQFADIGYSQPDFSAPGRGTKMRLRLLSESIKV